MNITLHLFINHSGEMFLFFVLLFNNNKQPLRSLGNYTICAGFMFSAFSIVFRRVDIVFLGALIIFLLFFMFFVTNISSTSILFYVLYIYIIRKRDVPFIFHKSSVCIPSLTHTHMHVNNYITFGLFEI